MGNEKSGLNGFKGGRYYQNGLTGVIGFVAPPGHGKNFLMAHVFMAAHRVVVFNTCGSYGNGTRNNPLPGFVFVYSIPDLIAVLRKAGRGATHVCFTPVGDDDMTAVFHDCCKLVMAFRDVVFVVDEIWNFHPSVAPGGLPKIQQQMFLQWRHYGLTLLWAAQQPQLVNSTARSVSTETYVGKFTDKLDVDAVARCKVKSPEAIARVQSLPPFQFVHQYEDGEWKIEQAPRR
jgi:hypothetical protein